VPREIAIVISATPFRMLQVHYQCCNAEVVRSDPILNPQNLHRRYACRERPGANYK